MPSQFSSEGTRERRSAGWPRASAATSARSRSRTSWTRSATRSASRPAGLEGLAAENLQARVRGVLLMALSNTFGWLVVSTGNKSELAVGYSTLYGDMVGGYRAPQGRLQDGRVPARAPPERARGQASSYRRPRSSALRAPSSGPTSETRTRSRPTTSSTPSSRRTSSSTARARSCSTSSTPRSSSRSSRSSIARSTSDDRRLRA